MPRRRAQLARIFALLFTGAIAVAARGAERHYLFPVGELPTARAATSDFVVRELVARDGVHVRALELPPPPGARVVVDFHNNRDTIESRAELARSLRRRGLGVLLVEYRGYGDSPGKAGLSSLHDAPSEEGLYLDAEAALDALAARGIGRERIVLLGTSLGTGVAAEMARRGRGDRLVLVSPYTSVPDLVTNVAPGVPAMLLMPDHFDTLAKARSIVARTLVIHGDADEVVPFWMGERIKAAIAGARLVRVRGGHHGDLFARDGARLLAEISAFAE